MEMEEKDEGETYVVIDMRMVTPLEGWMTSRGVKNVATWELSKPTR